MGAYEVVVDGVPVKVERVDRFEVPVNFARFGFSKACDVLVRSAKSLEGARVSPLSKGIASSAKGGELRFSLSEPAYLVVEAPGAERLFIFADPEEKNPPRLGDPEVRSALDYAGVDPTGAKPSTKGLQAAIDAASGSVAPVVYVPAGVYLSDSLYLKDGVTLYLAEGARLVCATKQGSLMSHPEGMARIEWCSRGFICMNGVRGARVAGRGVVDGVGTALKAYKRKMFLVKIEESVDCSVEGIVSLDSCFWNTFIYRSSGIRIRDYKVINNRLDDEWNETDGVDFDNCVESSLYNAFLYTGDDCMAVKSDDLPEGASGDDPSAGPYMEVANIAHEKVVCYSGSAACKVGTKTQGELMSGISFKDIDVVAANRGLVIDNVDTARVRGTLFSDIRVERVAGRLIDFNIDVDGIFWRSAPGKGQIEDTVIEGLVSATGAECRFAGRLDPTTGDEHLVKGVSFKGAVIAGKPVLGMGDARFNVNEYARDFSFE
jgi:hypothetical protein